MQRRESSQEPWVLLPLGLLQQATPIVGPTAVYLDLLLPVPLAFRHKESSCVLMVPEHKQTVESQGQ